MPKGSALVPRVGEPEPAERPASEPADEVGGGAPEALAEGGGLSEPLRSGGPGLAGDGSGGGASLRCGSR